ncbi:MAG: hypothetical protein ABUL42_04275 [Terricaulis silvestris]
MAKGQKRSNRETKKPKQEKKAQSAPVGSAGSVDPIRATISARRPDGKPRS